ncbi:MAG: DUF2784 domain-containing protein [bacterium]
MPTIWISLAWFCVVLHFGFLVYLLAGGYLLFVWGWSLWVHLALVAYAIAIQILDFRCFLTDLELYLRDLGGYPTYEGGFLLQYIWKPLGLEGQELSASVAFFIAVVIANLYPYGKILNSI